MIMVNDPGPEKRRHQRLPVSSEIIGHELSLLGLPEETKKIVRGRVEDISQGGICVQTSHPLTVSFPIRGELAFPATPVAVPVILKVQWTQKISPKDHRYRSGLQFLL